MKKEVTATIVYPVNVTIEVEANASDDSIRNALLDAAERNEQEEPVIHDCSIPELVD